MKNSECTIAIVSNKSNWTQTYRKIDGEWVQITNGIHRSLSAEQLLSHILPKLAANYRGNFEIIVWPDIKKNGKK